MDAQQQDQNLKQYRLQQNAQQMQRLNILPDQKTTPQIDAFMNMDGNQKNGLSAQDYQILYDQMNLLSDLHPELQEQFGNYIEILQKKLMNNSQPPPQAPSIYVNPQQFAPGGRFANLLAEKYPRIVPNQLNPAFIAQQKAPFQDPQTLSLLTQAKTFLDKLVGENPRDSINNAAKVSPQEIAKAVYSLKLLQQLLPQPGKAAVLSNILYDVPDSQPLLASRLQKLMGKGTKDNVYLIDEMIDTMQKSVNMGSPQKQAVVNMVNSQPAVLKQIYKSKYLGPDKTPFQIIDQPAGVLYSTYLQQTPFDSSLKLNKDTLALFPQWAYSQKLRHKKRQELAQQYQGVKKRLKDPNDQHFSYLASISPNVRWNPTSQMWVGKGIQPPDDSKKAIAFKQRLQVSRPLLTMQLTQQQRDSQIPLVVKDIVAANSNLSSTGFGPISGNSLSLYAGRWIDQATGRIRVLPTADSKYINPLSLQQKKAYYQAKIINHWNNLVSDTQQYTKYSSYDPKRYEELQLKKLKAQSNYSHNLFQYCQFINSQLISRGKINIDPKNYKQMILNAIPPAKAISLAKLKPTKQDTQFTVSQDQQKLKIAEWTQLVSTASKSIEKSIDSASQVGNYDKLVQKDKLGKAQLSLINYLNNKLATTSKDLMRATLIPTSMKGSQMIKFYQQLDSLSQKLRQFGKKVVTKPLTEAERTKVSQGINKLINQPRPGNFQQAQKKMTSFMDGLSGVTFNRQDSGIGTLAKGQRKKTFQTVIKAQKKKNALRK